MLIPSFMAKSLVILLIGNNEASEIYVKKKLERAKERRIKAELIRFDDSISKEILINKIGELNRSEEVGGILVQLPLPQTIKESTREILDNIDLTKDVD